jgi:hypothetical protein
MVGRNLCTLDCIKNGCLIIEQPSCCVGENLLDLRRGQAPPPMSPVRFAFNEFVRDVVTIAPRALDRVARRQRFTLRVEQSGGERAGGRISMLASAHH